MHGSGGVEKAQFTSSNAYGKSSTVNCYTFAGGATAVTILNIYRPLDPAATFSGSFRTYCAASQQFVLQV